MTIIRLCNYYVLTSYKKTDAKEKIEEEWTKFVEKGDPDMPFSLDHFVESLTEDGQDFELMTDLNDEDPDIEYNEEQVDEFVDKIVSGYEDEEEDGFYLDDEDEEDASDDSDD